MLALLSASCATKDAVRQKTSAWPARTLPAGAAAEGIAILGRAKLAAVIRRLDAGAVVKIFALGGSFTSAASGCSSRAECVGGFVGLEHERCMPHASPHGCPAFIGRFLERVVAILLAYRTCQEDITSSIGTHPRLKVKSNSHLAPTLGHQHELN